MHYFMRISLKLMRLNNRFLILFTAAFVLFSTIVIYVIEPDTFGNIFNALYWVMTTMATVGYGDFYPKTALGKAFTIFLYIFGIGLLSLGIGKIIEYLAGLKKRRESGKMKYHGANHIIIIGWSKKAQYAVDEILSSDPSVDVVIVDDLEKHPFEHKHVHFISGDPTAEETLEMAGLQKARSALIFADGKIEDSSLIDGKSLLITSTIERMAPKVHTTVEIILEKHIKNFEHVKVNDFILSHDAVSRMAARSALCEGNVEILNQLISRQHGEDLFVVPRKDSWLTFKDAFDDLLQMGATLIANHADLGINRKLNSHIPENAKLFVICDNDTYKKIIGECD